MATLDNMTDKELEALSVDLSLKVATISKDLEVINATIQARKDAETASRREAVDFIRHLGEYTLDSKAVQMVLDLKKYLIWRGGYKHD